MSGKEATTMTVRAMGALLGLKKTESYYLVNKKVFDTVMVAGQRRVVKASFEEWYARQDRYRKVDGEPPGAKLHSNMYSVSDLQKMLNLSQDSVLELIHREKFLTMTLKGNSGSRKSYLTTGMHLSPGTGSQRIENGIGQQRKAP